MMARVCKTYLVIIVCQSLPVVIANQTPLMIKVVLAHVELGQPWLKIHILEVILPWTGFLISIEIHPNKPKMIDMNMNLEETVGGFVKVGQVLVLRRLCKLAIEAIRPTYSDVSCDEAPKCKMTYHGICKQ